MCRADRSNLVVVGRGHYGSRPVPVGEGEFTADERDNLKWLHARLISADQFKRGNVDLDALMVRIGALEEKEALLAESGELKFKAARGLDRPECLAVMAEVKSGNAISSSAALANPFKAVNAVAHVRLSSREGPAC